MSKPLTLLAVLLPLLAAACAETPQRESLGQFVDSSVITANVKAKLFDDPVTHGFKIHVETYKGVVQLSGFVSSAKEKQRAEALARSVAGVRAVKNSLVIKSRK